ncbi:MAG: redoxin domain-containing protein [Chloroflexi bacterium]|nr:redoxin domain-containing protein [Chloroflexota bacterium]
MARKLTQKDRLPPINLDLADGRNVTLPDDIAGRYLVLLVYRGNWCSYCMRHLKRYQEKLLELEELGVQVIAASADTQESAQAAAVESGITFPLAYGVTEEAIAGLDPWWTDDHHGHYVHPIELLVLRGGTVFGSMYASGPVGRMDVEEVLTSVRSRERRRLVQQEQAARA